MKKELFLWTIVSFITLNNCAAQEILDSCFSSVAIGPTYNGSATLSNAYDADMLEWTGTAWNGGWGNANITVPPPCNNPLVRALWIGDQSVWTSGGEAFGLRFSPPLVPGNTYVFYFTYVSDGFGSNGAFSPDVSTNNTGGLGGNLVGNLVPAGFAWETHPFIFTAVPAQAGDDYLIVHSNDGSGMVLSLCAETFTDLGEDSLTICFGDSAILHAGNGFQSYSWNTGDTTNQITVHNSGTYISTNVGFCGTSSDTIVVTVDPCGMLPVAVFTNPDNHICPGTCTDFTNLSQNATSYVWNFAGGTPSVSTDTDPNTICYNVPGTYSVELIATNGISSDTLTLNNFITVYPFPSPQGILQSGDTLFANAGAVSYEWFLNSVLIPGATDYFYIATGSGNYNVVATDNNGCEVEAVINDVIAGISQMAISSEQISIFPVPSKDELFITRQGSSILTCEISVYNVAGVPAEISSKPETIIDVHLLSPGIYYLELQAAEKTYCAQFIKQ